MEPISVFHVSPNLFERVDPERIVNSSRIAQNEFGWGFYAGDGNDAWEYAQSHKRYVTYRVEIPAEEYERFWLKWDKPIGEENYNRLIAKATETGNTEMLERLKLYSPASPGIEISELTRDLKNPRATSEFFASAGIKGYRYGSYHVFYDPANLKLKVYEAKVDNPEAIPKHMLDDRSYVRKAEPDLIPVVEEKPQKAVPQKSVPPPAAQNTPDHPIAKEFKLNGTIASDELRSGYNYLQSVNPALAEKFKPLLDHLHTGPAAISANDGFNARNMIGYAIQRGLSGEYLTAQGNASTHENILKNLKNHVYADDPKLHALADDFFTKHFTPHINAQKIAPPHNPNYKQELAPPTQKGVTPRAAGNIISGGVVGLFAMTAALISGTRPADAAAAGVEAMIPGAIADREKRPLEAQYQRLEALGVGMAVTQPIRLLNDLAKIRGGKTVDLDPSLPVFLAQTGVQLVKEGLEAVRKKETPPVVNPNLPQPPISR